MSGKLQRTYIAWHDAWVESSRELTEKHVLPPQVHMNVITCPTPPVHTCTYRQPQTSMSFLRKFTWTLLHAPPHPTPPVHTCTYRQPQTSMSFLRKFTWTLLHAPPHPTPPPPMCTKHNGLLKAVVQLYSRIFPDQILPGKRQTQVFRKTWVVLPKKVIFEIYSKFGPFGPFLPGTQSSAKLASLTRWCPLVINLFI